MYPTEATFPNPGGFGGYNPSYYEGYFQHPGPGAGYPGEGYPCHQPPLHGYYENPPLGPTGGSVPPPASSPTDQQLRHLTATHENNEHAFQ